MHSRNPQLWFQSTRPTFPLGSTPAEISVATMTAHDALMLQYPSKTGFTADWMLLIGTVNGMKERVCSLMYPISRCYSLTVPALDVER